MTQTAPQQAFPVTLQWSTELTINTPEEFDALANRMKDGEVPDLSDEGPEHPSRNAMDWEREGDVIVGWKVGAKSYLMFGGIRRYCRMKQAIINEVWRNTKTGQARTCRKFGPWEEEYCIDMPSSAPPLPDTIPKPD